MSEATVVIIQEEEMKLTERAIRRLIWKLDRRLLPFLCLLELNRFGFQVAIGYTELTTFKNDLHLTIEQNNWATSVFFLAYLIFAIPSSLLLRVIGATRYLSLSLILWGGISIGMAFITNGYQFIILRFFLGMVIAGYFPGIITYLSLWYRRRDQILRIAIFCTSTFASGAFFAFLAYVIIRLHGIPGLEYWQWLSLIPGVVITLLGMMTYFNLDYIPETVQWLDNIEKQLLTNILRNDEGVIKIQSESDSLLSWYQVRCAFVDWKIYLYTLIAIGIYTSKKYLVMFLPSIIDHIGYHQETIFLAMVLPYVVSCLSILVLNYSLLRYHGYAFHLIISIAISLLGFLLMIFLHHEYKVFRYLSLCLACSGTFSSIPILLSWLTSNIAENTKRTLAVGMLLAFGQIVGIFKYPIYYQENKTTYKRSHIITISFLISAIILTLILRFCLAKANSRRQYLSDGKNHELANTIKPCDWHPDNRYVL